MANFAKPWGEYILRELVETKPPAPISWMPSTWGWQCVFLFISIYLFYRGYQAYKRYQKNIYRRTSLAWFAQFSELDELTKSKAIFQIPMILKATAIQAYGRKIVNPLNKHQWPIWLDDNCSKTNFDDKYGVLLYKLAYAPEQNFDASQLAQLIEQCKLWIQFHRRDDD